MPEVTPAIRRLRRLAPLALVVVLAAACGDNNKSTAKKPKTSPGTTIGTRPARTVPTGIGTGNKHAGKPTLVVGKRNLFPLLRGSIRRFAPTQVTGKSLRVVALAGPSSFWAGRSAKQRILVSMRLKGGATPKITVGENVSFVGLLTAAPASAGPGGLGVRNTSDQTLLAKQGAYVDASVADVKLG